MKKIFEVPHIVPVQDLSLSYVSNGMVFQLCPQQNQENRTRFYTNLSHQHIQQLHFLLFYRTITLSTNVVFFVKAKTQINFQLIQIQISILMKAIAKEHRFVTQFCISGLQVDDGIIKILKEVNWKFLVKVSLIKNYITHLGIQMLASMNLNYLKQLDLESNKIDSEGVSILKNISFKYLKNLNLSKNPINSKGIKTLSSFYLPSLQELTLYRIYNIFSALLYLRKLPNKEKVYLSLSGQEINEKRLVQMIPELGFQRVQFDSDILHDSGQWFNQNTFVKMNINDLPQNSLKNEDHSTQVKERQTHQKMSADQIQQELLKYLTRKLILE